MASNIAYHERARFPPLFFFHHKVIFHFFFQMNLIIFIFMQFFQVIKFLLLAGTHAIYSNVVLERNKKSKKKCLQ